MYIRPTWWLYFAVFCQHLIKHVMMMIQAEPVTHRALYRHSLQHTGLDSGTACYTHGFHNHVIMNCRVLSCCLFRKNKKVVSESFGSMSCINRKTCSVKLRQWCRQATINLIQLLVQLPHTILQQQNPIPSIPYKSLSPVVNEMWPCTRPHMDTLVQKHTFSFFKILRYRHLKFY